MVVVGFCNRQIIFHFFFQKILSVCVCVRVACSNFPNTHFTLFWVVVSALNNKSSSQKDSPKGKWKNIYEIRSQKESFDFDIQVSVCVFSKTLCKKIKDKNLVVCVDSAR